MLTVGIAMLLELMMGVLTGYFFTDKKRGLSYNDIKVAGILFMLVNTFLLLKGDVGFIFLTHMIGAFIVISGGILLGEYIRVVLAKKLLDKTIQKETVYENIKYFIELAREVATGRETPEQLEREFRYVSKEIGKIKRRVSSIRQPDKFNHLQCIGEACERVMRLSKNSKLEHSDMARYQNITNELSNLAWDTLIQTESHISKELSRPVQVMSYSIKTARIK